MRQIFNFIFFYTKWPIMFRQHFLKSYISLLTCAISTPRSHAYVKWLHPCNGASVNKVRWRRNNGSILGNIWETFRKDRQRGPLDTGDICVLPHFKSGFHQNLITIMKGWSSGSLQIFCRQFHHALFFMTGFSVLALP